MNDKLKELAGKANFGHVESDEVVFDKRLEVFAELIVRECIDYCGENLSKTVGGALKIHFGFEE